MNPDPYARIRRYLLITGAAIFAWLLATAAFLGFGVPAGRDRHHAAARDMAMAATVPAATAHSSAGGQWLAVLLLVLVVLAVIVAGLASIRQAFRTRSVPAEPAQPKTVQVVAHVADDTGEGWGE